jgi:hypothetical protein
MPTKCLAVPKKWKARKALLKVMSSPRRKSRPKKWTTPPTNVRVRNLCNGLVGVAWMIQQITDMDEFQMNRLTNDKLQLFYQFLESVDYNKLFVWLNDDLDIETSFDSAPKFFGK